MASTWPSTVSSTWVQQKAVRNGTRGSSPFKYWMKVAFQASIAQRRQDAINGTGKWAVEPDEPPVNGDAGDPTSRLDAAAAD
jgi:hypothetical protein